MAITLRDAAQTVALFRQASRQVLNSPMRRGCIVELHQDNAEKIVVGADIHGRKGVLDALVEMAQLDESRLNHLVVQELLHGGPTYPNGGCRSHELLEEVAQLINRYPTQVHLLMSNHEMAEATDFPICKGSKVLNLGFRCGLRHAYQDHMEEVRQAARQFILTSPLAVRVGRILVTHSLPEGVDRIRFDKAIFDRSLLESDLAQDGMAFRLVWGRDSRAENASAFAKSANADFLITAHQPASGGFQVVGREQIVLNACGEPFACLVLHTSKPPQCMDDLVREIRLLKSHTGECGRVV